MMIKAAKHKPDQVRIVSTCQTSIPGDNHHKSIFYRISSREQGVQAFPSRLHGNVR